MIEEGCLFHYFDDVQSHFPDDNDLKEVGIISYMGAPLVDQYMEDQTPESELKKKPSADDSGGYREKGSGRPTKRDRRNMDRFFG